MATLVATPNPARVGDSIAFLGDGFDASTETAVKINSEGFAAEVVSDAGGLISNDDIGDHADGTLTAAGNPANNETVTLGSRIYTFKTTLTGAANEVKVGTAATDSLDNLKAAVNGAAGAGTTYGVGTVAHADVIAGAKDATSIVFVARLAGTAGDSIATTETSATALSFGGATLSGGAGDPTGFKQMNWTPIKEGTYTVDADDGTNSASVKVKVFRSA